MKTSCISSLNFAIRPRIFVLTLAVFAVLIRAGESFAQAPPLSHERQCSPAAKDLTLPVRLRSGKRLDAKVLKPVFESLAKSVSQSSLSSLCDAVPRFECWNQKGIPEDRLEFIELSKTRVLIRVACSISAYNASSFYVAFDIGTPSTIVTASTKRGKSKSNSGATQPSLREPALMLFPNHSGLLNGPHAYWGLRPMEAIVGTRFFDEKSNSLFAYTKGLGNGTIGHFHHYRFAAKDGLPRLVISASKIIDDGKDEFQFHPVKSRFPPVTASWVRFKPKGELRGCLSGFHEFGCSKFNL